MVVRFSFQDLELFAAASHDRNPLHLSAAYARRTPYGQQVVFGILGALACLQLIGPRTVSKLKVEFLRPLFLDTDYTVAIADSSGVEKLIEVRDGSTVVIRSNLMLTGSVISIQWDGSRRPSLRSTPGNPMEVLPGDAVAGEYLPNMEPFNLLLSRFELAPRLALPVAALLFSSYLVGMELPGERALFFKLVLEFDKEFHDVLFPLAFSAQVLSVNAVNLMRADLALRAGNGIIASGEVCAFIRPTSAPDEKYELIPRSVGLAGKVALVMGASRGLGASITKALAVQGCTVLANYQHSVDEAQKLSESAVLVQGDASNLNSCRAIEHQIASQYGRLDFLICNACPSPLPVRLEADTVERINAYVGHAIALVTVPMAVFLDRVAEARGWAVTISSVFVEAVPKDIPQYVAAKFAVEGLTRVAAKQYKRASFLVVRAPKMLTDMNKTPFGNESLLHPGVIAAQIVDRIQGSRIAEKQEFLSWGVKE